MLHSTGNWPSCRRVLKWRGWLWRLSRRAKLRFVRTYGVTDRSTPTPVTPDTLFRWASVSKTVTGALAATLASEGVVDLERPVDSWQSTLRLPGGAQSRVTLSAVADPTDGTDQERL